ncbi:hypothetical protein JCM8097_003934 [Rhodosporidiobolus ruineniae]
MSTSRLIVLGATGETGKQALTAALQSAEVSHVYSFGRTAPTVDPSVSTAKLTHTSLDFDALLAEKSAGEGSEGKKLRDAEADAVVIALGTTKKNAGSAEKFEKIDREYVLAAAKAARREDKPNQRVVYVSAQAASSSSSFLYPRSKGLTEEGLAALGYAETVIFRPGFLVVPGGRKEGRLAEQAFGAVTNLLSTFTPSLQIPTPVLGRALVAAATSAPSALKLPAHGHEETYKTGQKAWVVPNAQAIKLGGAESGKA